ncbi:MAG: IS66 family transposase zinc-finger binding domain-containing protein [Firmicutes bacterium]|nr:IS66 family transposase zinc-finger binding domain-containing protein [Bacillota bacterium]
MSAEIHRELQVIPAQVKVLERVQQVYACRQCEQTALTTPIKTAPMPRPVYPGSLASASLLAFVKASRKISNKDNHISPKSPVAFHQKRQRNLVKNAGGISPIWPM